MKGPFGFVDMLFNYKERCVRNDKTEGFTLDTALVTNRDYQYETAVKSPYFKGGNWLVLEGSDTKEQALVVHEKWLAVLSCDVHSLRDCADGVTYKKEEIDQ